MTVVVLAVYLSLVLMIGLASNRLFRGTGEDFFLATRTIGPFLLLMSLFGTHMTAFSLLGASGEAYRRGIGVFSLMASSSALVVPVVFYFVGIRLWALGKRHGYLTQVQYFRERWDSDGLGLLLFVVLVAGAQARLEAEQLQELPAPAGVFAEDQGAAGERVAHPRAGVTEVADGSRDDEERSAHGVAAPRELNPSLPSPLR